MFEPDRDIWLVDTELLIDVAICVSGYLSCEGNLDREIRQATQLVCERNHVPIIAGLAPHNQL